MRRVLYRAAVRRSLEQLLAYLTEQTGTADQALAVVLSLQRQCEKLAALPGQLGRPREDLAPGVRSFAFRGYVIFFRYGEDIFDVVAILHERRDVATHWGDDAPDA